MSKLPYNTAIVTGASSGIGKEIAKSLSEQGVTVFALARSKENLLQARKELSKAAQDRFVALPCDLTKPEQIADTITKIRKQSNTVDLLVNNAGVGVSRRFEELSHEDIQTILATNLHGTTMLTQGVLKTRDKTKPLQIVLVTSLAGKTGFPELSMYSASKFGLEGLAEALRHEYATSNVAITVLRPGITDTNFFAKAGMDNFRESVKDTKSFYSPARVADEFIKKAPSKPNAITVGNDKYFLRILPFVPFKYRFTVLDIINKL